MPHPKCKWRLASLSRPLSPQRHMASVTPDLWLPSQLRSITAVQLAGTKSYCLVTETARVFTWYLKVIQLGIESTTLSKVRRSNHWNMTKVQGITFGKFCTIATFNVTQGHNVEKSKVWDWTTKKWDIIPFHSLTKYWLIFEILPLSLENMQ